MTKVTRDCTKITLKDWHDGPHSVHREVSLLAHLKALADQENMSPENMTRALIAQSPMFRDYMREYWARVTK